MSEAVKQVSIVLKTLLQGEDAYDKVNREVTALGGKLESFNVTTRKNKQGQDEYTASLSLYAQTLTKVREIEANVSRTLDPTTNLRNRSIFTDIQAQKNNEAREAETLERQRLKELVAINKIANNEVLTNLNQRLELEKSIRLNGVTSIKTLAIQASQDEKAARISLASNLKVIDDAVLANTITTTTQANQARIAQEQITASRITAIRLKLEQEQARLNQNKERASTFSTSASSSLSELTNRLNLEQSIRVAGTNSLKTLQIKAGQDEVSIKQTLATTLLSIEDRLQQGLLTTLVSANKEKVRAENQAAKDITAIRKSIEALQAKETKRSNLVSYAKEETAQLTNEYNRRLELQRSIRLNGINSLKTLELKASQDEQAIRSNLAIAIKAIEDKINNDLLTTKRQVTQAILQEERKAASEITKVRKALETEQAKVTARTNKVTTFREETNLIVAELNRRLQLELAIRQYGDQSNQAQALRAAHAELAIRQKLSTDLAAIEAKIQAGTRLTNSTGGFVSSTQARQILIDQAHAAITLANSYTVAEAAQRSFALRVLEGISIYKIYNFALSNIVQTLKSIPKVGIELDSTIASLTATTGSTAGLATVMSFLDKEAERTGISLLALRENFRNFQASTSLAGETLQSTANIFSNINTVITSLHLPADKAVGIFTALAQIFNKSKVQSEELVKQLGNLIPGAFASFAAANKGQFRDASDLINQMKKGTVFAHKTVENFAEYLADRFSKSFEIASQGLNANLGRMQNSFTYLEEAIYRLTVPTLNTAAKGLTGFINYLTLSVEGTTGLTTSIKALDEVLLFLAGTALIRVIDSSLLAASTLVGVGGAAARLSGAAYLLLTALDKVKAALLFFISPAAIVAGIGVIAYSFGNLQKEANATAEKVAEASKKILDTFNKPIKSKQEILLDLSFNVNKDETVVAIRKQIKDEQEAISKLSTPSLTSGFSTAEALKQNQQRLTYLKEAKSRLVELVKVEQEQVKVAKEKLAIDSSNIATNLSGVNPATELEKEKLKALSFSDPVKYAIENYLHLAAGDLKDLSNKVEIIPKNLVLLKNQLAELTNVVAHATGSNLEEAKVQVIILNDRIKEAEKALQDSQDTIKLIHSNAEESGKRAASTIAKQANSSATKETKDLYKNLVRDAKSANDIVEGEIRRLGYVYEDNLISLEDYYNSKRSLQEKDLGNQIQNIEDQIAIASKAKDASKLEELKDKKADTFTAANNKDEELSRAKVINLREYVKQLAEIKATSLELTGKGEEANIIRVNEAYKDREKYLAANNKEALSQLAIAKQYDLSKGKINELDRQESVNLANLQAIEERITIGKVTGFLKQRQAITDLINARKEYVKQEEVIIQKLEEELGKNKENVELQEKLLRAKQNLYAIQTAGAGNNAQLSTPQFKLDYDAAIQKTQSGKESDLNVANSIKDPIQKIAAIQKAESDYRKASLISNADYYQAVAGIAANSFLTITQAAVKMYGERSKLARAAFIAYKASAIAETIIATSKAVQVQLGAGPYIGFVLAGLAAAAGAIQVATIASQPIPQAHAGLTSVPDNNQTYLLSKGERVVAPEQNKDLTSYLNKQQQPQQSTNAKSEAPKIRIINVVDKSLFNEFLGSEEGEEVVMNIVRRNNAA